MILLELATWLAMVVVGAFTAPLGVRHVGVVIGGKEYYGGSCELRVFELMIDDVWYESEPVRCEQPRPVTK